MFDLEVDFVSTTRLDSLGRRLRVATEKNLINLTDVLYAKVIENLSGRILQEKSGQLRDSVQRTTDVMDGYYPLYIGTVYVSPITPKAVALEYGGKQSYLITPSKGEFLKFYWEKMGKTVYLRSVEHPPSKAFAYLRSALEEMESEILPSFRDNIQRVLDGELF